MNKCIDCSWCKIYCGAWNEDCNHPKSLKENPSTPVNGSLSKTECVVMRSVDGECKPEGILFSKKIKRTFFDKLSDLFSGE